MWLRWKRPVVDRQTPSRPTSQMGGEKGNRKLDGLVCGANLLHEIERGIAASQLWAGSPVQTLSFCGRRMRGRCSNLFLHKLPHGLLHSGREGTNSRCTRLLGSVFCAGSKHQGLTTSCRRPHNRVRRAHFHSSWCQVTDMGVCCIVVFQRPKLIIRVGKTTFKRRFSLGRKPRIVLYETCPLRLFSKKDRISTSTLESRV